MKEYCIHAIVLGVSNIRESDREVDLYSKEFGRIRAKAIAGQKILSKFSPHLDPLNYVQLRLVKKKGLTITDAVTENRFSGLRAHPRILGSGLTLLFLLRGVVGFEFPDQRLWFSMLRALRDRAVHIRTFLKLLGYDPLHARCETCGNVKVRYFVLHDQKFVCLRCSVNFKKNELLLF